MDMYGIYTNIYAQIQIYMCIDTHLRKSMGITDLKILLYLVQP